MRLFLAANSCEEQKTGTFPFVNHTRSGAVNLNRLASGNVIEILRERPAMSRTHTSALSPMQKIARNPLSSL